MSSVVDINESSSKAFDITRLVLNRSGLQTDLSLYANRHCTVGRPEECRLFHKWSGVSLITSNDWPRLQ